MDRRSLPRWARMTQTSNRFLDELSKLLTDADHAAHAHHHLGLLLERQGKWKEADAHFQKAQELAPEDFPPPDGHKDKH